MFAQSLAAKIINKLRQARAALKRKPKLETRNSKIDATGTQRKAKAISKRQSQRAARFVRWVRIGACDSIRRKLPRGNHNPFFTKRDNSRSGRRRAAQRRWHAGARRAAGTIS